MIFMKSLRYEHQLGCWNAGHNFFWVTATVTELPTIIKPHFPLQPWGVSTPEWIRRHLGTVTKNISSSSEYCLTGKGAKGSQQQP